MDIRIPATHSRKGVTLIELLVTVVVAIILSAIAIPAMQTLVMSNRMSTQVKELITALQGARSFAIAHQQRAVLCPSLDQIVCVNSSAWHSGWIVFADRNNNQQRERDEPVSRANNVPLKNLNISSSSGRTRITYQADGTAGGSNTTLTFCDARGADQARAVVIALNGRSRIARTKSDGGPLNCP